MQRVYGMTKFRPCIDLHGGQVKQIVGGTLRDDGAPIENHVSERSPAWFGQLYAKDELWGGHVIQLGPGNEEAACQALQAFPGGLQIGGGISPENAGFWLDAGASHVIVTSWLFGPDGKLLEDRLREMSQTVGRDRLVIDLSCRRTSKRGESPSWAVAMNRWQTLTNVAITERMFMYFSDFAAEFLVHAADVEGLCNGIDEELVAKLGKWSELPVTYAGGAASLDDVHRVEQLSGGNVDITVGSALDIFGGNGVTYRQLVKWNLEQSV